MPFPRGQGGLISFPAGLEHASQKLCAASAKRGGPEMWKLAGFFTYDPNASYDVEVTVLKSEIESMKQYEKKVLETAKPPTKSEGAAFRKWKESNLSAHQEDRASVGAHLKQMVTDGPGSGAPSDAIFLTVGRNSPPSTTEDKEEEPLSSANSTLSDIAYIRVSPSPGAEDASAEYYHGLLESFSSDSQGFPSTIPVQRERASGSWVDALLEVAPDLPLDSDGKPTWTLRDVDVTSSTAPRKHVSTGDVSRCVKFSITRTQSGVVDPGREGAYCGFPTFKVDLQCQQRVQEGVQVSEGASHISAHEEQNDAADKSNSAGECRDSLLATDNASVSVWASAGDNWLQAYSVFARKLSCTLRVWDDGYCWLWSFLAAAGCLQDPTRPTPMDYAVLNSVLSTLKTAVNEGKIHVPGSSKEEVTYKKKALFDLKHEVEPGRYYPSAARGSRDLFPLLSACFGAFIIIIMDDAFQGRVPTRGAVEISSDVRRGEINSFQPCQTDDGLPATKEEGLSLQQLLDCLKPDNYRYTELPYGVLRHLGPCGPAGHFNVSLQHHLDSAKGPHAWRGAYSLWDVVSKEYNSPLTPTRIRQYSYAFPAILGEFGATESEVPRFYSPYGVFSTAFEYYDFELKYLDNQLSQVVSPETTLDDIRYPNNVTYTAEQYRMYMQRRQFAHAVTAST